MNTSCCMGGTPITTKEMLKMLDKDGNDKIELEEWVEANVEAIMVVRDVEKSAKGIYRTAKSVDMIIPCLLLCIVVISYGKILR
jgi:hypothetical protein